ncbi:MAG: epimerase, partial [Candidatus Rokuibacteriota bacterium]
MTGASGLLGACLVDRLRARGTPLRLLDVVPPPDDAGTGGDFVRADIPDRRALADACRDVEVVYHLAAAQRMKPQFAGLDEDEIYAMNLAGVENVLAAALETGVRKVVHISSSGVYGIPRSVPVGEDHPQRPLGAYGRSKIAGEETCRRALERGLDVTIFRP